MASKFQIRKLIDASETLVREAIDRAYANAMNDHQKPASALRDFVTNMSWHDRWTALIDRETEHEKRHNRSAPAGSRFMLSNRDYARILVLCNVAEGAKPGRAKLDAVNVLQFRDTAFEATLVGNLIEGYLMPDAITTILGLDYSALKQA